MGEVYRAHDTLLKRDIALKILSKRSLGTEGQTRLLQEAQFIAKLSHPNIVTVYDVGEQDGLPFIVMELVEGQSLNEHKPDDLDAMIAIARSLCAALQHAHDQGIIHRDIKPENVLIEQNGNAKLMDFGIARSAASRLTEEGALLGTILYIAPEQALGKEIDHRADLYSLGVLLYELASGKLPFEAEDALAVITQHLHAPVVPPRAWNEAIPVELDRLILRLMEKHPENRPNSASEVLEVLESIGDRTGSGIAAAGPIPRAEVSMIDRIIGGRIVGRLEELSEARALWRKAVDGEGQLLLISGEPGVGKTRLVNELITQAHISAGRVLMGASYAEWEPPYAPFRQIVRDAFRDSPASIDELGELVIVDLVRIAPELRQDFPDLVERPPENPQNEQQRMMDSMVVFTNLLCNLKPVLLVLEDAHWSDSSTFALLRHLARNTRHQRLMIVVTYREVELDEARSLHETLLDFSREKMGVRMKLKRLNRQETRDMLVILLAEEITEEFLDGIYRETEGNPFFIEEVCKALVESGKLYYRDGRWHRPSMEEMGVPQSIQITIQSRLRGLSEEAQSLLELAAVLGRQFDFDTLLNATDLGENTLIDGLEEASHARLIEETGNEYGGSFAFAHALIPATLVSSLRTLRRRRLHRQAATGLEAVHPDAYEALAHQYIEAGETDKGVAYLIQAGDRARGLYAHHEAIDSYQQALEHLEDAGELGQAASIQMKLGLTYHTDFRFQEARQAYQEGFNLWQQVGKVGTHTPLPDAPHPLRSLMNEPLSLDPGLDTDGWSAQILDNIFSGLVESNPEQDIVPDAAYRWEVLREGRLYRFHLHDNATWSDGVPVTAQDFEFAWKRVLDPGIGSRNAEFFFPIKNAEAYHQGVLKDPNAVGVHARDPFTLEVELERPSSAFLYVLSDNVSSPIPRHVLLEHAGAWTDPDNLVTNGPFRLIDWKRGESLILEANPSYTGSFPGNLRGVEMKFYSNLQAGEDLALYQENLVDFLWLGQTADFNRGRYQYPEEFRTAPFLRTFYIGFNTQRVPFNDQRVRRALGLATDRENLVNTVYEEKPYPATGGYLPPGMPGYSEGIALPYDPPQARHLLAEAGYPGGDGFPEVEFLLTERPTTPKFRDYLQAQWLENLGIQVSWNIQPWEAFLKQVHLEKPHLWAMAQFADHPDPDLLLQASNVGMGTGWSNEEYKEKVALAREAMDQEERLRLYQEADRILVEQVPILPIEYARFTILIKPWVRRFPLSPTRGWFWKEVIIEPHSS